MNDDVTNALEQFLLERGDWVESEEICAEFNLPSDRPLRAIDGAPGLCTAFAISGDKGFKHVANATTGEWLRFKHRLRKHGIGELVRVRDLSRRRQDVSRQFARRAFRAERDTGQGLLFGT